MSIAAVGTDGVSLPAIEGLPGIVQKQQAQPEELREGYRSMHENLDALECQIA